MDTSKEIAMKQHVLEMLKTFMMGNEGSKFAPKAVSVEMVGKPKESLVGDDEESPMEDMGEGPESEEEDGKKPKMSLKDLSLVIASPFHEGIEFKGPRFIFLAFYC